MKIFYTERDIEDKFAAGVRHLEVNDDVVITDLAREKAAALGISLIPVDQTINARSSPGNKVSAAAPTGLDPEALAAEVKARVIARLGTDEYSDLLDQVIPQVLARLNLQASPERTDSTNTSENNY